MLNIRDIQESDRQEFFQMAKEFYGGPACDHMFPADILGNFAGMYKK